MRIWFIARKCWWGTMVCHKMMDGKISSNACNNMAYTVNFWSPIALWFTVVHHNLLLQFTLKQFALFLHSSDKDLWVYLIMHKVRESLMYFILYAYLIWKYFALLQMIQNVRYYNTLFYFGLCVWDKDSWCEIFTSAAFVTCMVY